MRDLTVNRLRGAVGFVISKFNAAVFCVGIIVIAYFVVMYCYSPEPGAGVPLLFLFFACIGLVPLFLFVCKCTNQYRWLKLLVYISSWLFVVISLAFYFLVYLE